MASPNHPPQKDFQSLLSTLTSHPAPVLPPPKTIEPTLSGPIAALSLHPTLETALHILNGDLPSAHFLVRHMQAPPAFEGMFLHGILHRVEGDYDNARAWYGNVSESDAFHSAWPGEDGLDDARAFIGRIEALRKQGRGDESALERESRREFEAVIEWCRNKFGEGEMGDASQVWVQPSKEHKEISEKMIIGGEGWRTF